MSYSKDHDDHVQAEGGWSADVVNVESALGAVQLEVCNKCGYTLVLCEHRENTWSAEGTELTCDLCGADVT